mmetsp:Transcript_13277/g.22657  ORF Transcript_13277/g.22657 Transcript_13277/m.22657 type:complete len:248 (-) Transcript_13277:43-786(-)
MSSSQSFDDFERDYNTHLSKVRSFLAQPTANASNSSHYETDVKSCQQALHEAKQCIHAMQGLAEIEGDPFKAEEAKRKLEREIGPLESEMRGRKYGGRGNNKGITSVFGNGSAQSNGNTDYLFGNRSHYAPPSLGENDIEYGDFSAPLTEMEQRMQDSEHLLRETQALCTDSEQIGASTLETMGRQREQIERSSNLIQQSLENTEQARRIMKEMASRALRNKLVLYCMIALLLIANAMAIHHLWTKK